MGASGKWVKALIGLKKPDKDEHVSQLVLLTSNCMRPSKLYYFFHYLFGFCVGERGW